jgi:hypothetical protein
MTGDSRRLNRDGPIRIPTTSCIAMAGTSMRLLKRTAALESRMINIKKRVSWINSCI